MYLRSIPSRHTAVLYDLPLEFEGCQVAIDVFDDRWQIPIAYNRSVGPRAVVTFWAKTYCDATGKLPDCPPYKMTAKAGWLIAKLGFEAVMRTLAFMATPYSKYYQYPYTLNVVEVAYEEFKEIKATGHRVFHDGFIGQLNLRNLGD